MAGATTAFTVQGRTLSLPVEVRAARSWAAQYVVEARRAQRLIQHTGLEVAEPIPGRALVSLAFIRYLDTDLGAYDEVAVGVLVRHHAAPPAGAPGKLAEILRRRACVYIHHLPVNQTFTLEAGRRIWGYPKFMADIEIADEGARTTCTLREQGDLILSLSARTGGLRGLPAESPPTYTCLDGMLRLTRWDTRGTRALWRPGGTSLTLGPHPIGEELRSLGLPKRALMTLTIPRFRARFGAPEIVDRP